MASASVICLAVLVSAATCELLTADQLAKAIPGHLELDPEFRKLHPSIPGPYEHVDPFIVGGVESTPHSRQYQVGIYTPVTTAGISFCGGTLINARTVVTAAHCVDLRVGNLSIFMGAHNMPPGGDLNIVARFAGDVVIHEGWNRSILLHDIALVRFEVAVPLSASIIPILLPRDASNDYLGNTTLVSGWGRASDSINTISPVLREVTSWVISNYACRMAYLGIVQDSHICISGAHGRGTCNGDSGGPLVVNGVLIGVVSFGSAFGCEVGWPSAMARITSYLDWIRQNQAPAENDAGDNCKEQFVNMASATLLCVAALVSATAGQLLTAEQFANAVPGHLELDPEFRKLHPNIPGPQENVDPFIVGGVEAIPHSRPYQVAVYSPITATGFSFCGGSLINARTVITAAHCVDRRIGNLSVFMGAHNMPPGTAPNVISRSSDDVLIHEGWNRAILLHDIAIVRFETPVPLSANITPVLLPRDATHDYLGNTTLVTGWGRPSDSINAISPVLREVTSWVISNYACRMAYLGTVQDSHICISGAHGRGTCQGDSGGPLVINGALIGVVSFGSAFGCEVGWPSAMARVTSYLDWISQNQAPA
ncbi:transmembrane protease serine 9 [Dendroctonus ponderosae]|uniref:transmembrane protease serine 9 n=1 Tax=Dendroctonus ponderosae TaxID=77166 RepID=UPI002035D564|nr:transmembrane protease serine 9 [Dendroctonus ponderosae]